MSELTRPSPEASPATTGKGPMDGIALIATERQRQLSVEGWTPEHDDNRHRNGSLAMAASCYAVVAKCLSAGYTLEQASEVAYGYDDKNWPWTEFSWKPSRDPIRNLEKAGALIAAEIDRLLRKESSEGHSTDEQGGLPVTPNSSSPASTQGAEEKTFGKKEAKEQR